MKAKDHLKLLAEMFLIVLVAFSLAVTITIIISPLFYQIVAKIMSLDLEAGLSLKQLSENFQVIVKYLLSPSQMDLVMPYFESSANGLIHFKEVKVLVQTNLWLGIVLLVGLVFYLIKMKRPRRKYAHRPYRIVAIGLPLVLLFLTVVMFDRVFIAFHKLLFRNDLWLFDPAVDPVINVLPEEFFAVMFVVAILIYELLVLLIYKIREKRY